MNRGVIVDTRRAPLLAIRRMYHHLGISDDGISMLSTSLSQAFSQPSRRRLEHAIRYAISNTAEYGVCVICMCTDVYVPPSMNARLCLVDTDYMATRTDLGPEQFIRGSDLYRIIRLAWTDAQRPRIQIALLFDTPINPLPLMPYAQLHAIHFIHPSERIESRREAVLESECPMSAFHCAPSTIAMMHRMHAMHTTFGEMLAEFKRTRPCDSVYVSTAQSACTYPFHADARRPSIWKAICAFLNINTVLDDD